MELIAWWMMPLMAILVAVTLFLARASQARRDHTRERLPLANSFRLLALPEYKLFLKRYAFLTRAVLVACILSLFLLVIISGRPAAVSVVQPDVTGRDIVLCLDVHSLLAINMDARITKTYVELAKQFKDERLGLVAFDASPVTIFPLTDNREFIVEQLSQFSKKAEKYYESLIKREWSTGKTAFEFRDLVRGTEQGDTAHVATGDGLASCVNRFDRADSKRLRSVVFSAESRARYIDQNQVVTLPEAAAIAKDKNIRIYGMNLYDHNDTDSDVFKSAMLATNGDYYAVNEGSDILAIRGIANKIAAQEATRFKGSPRLLRIDQPQIYIYMFMALLVVLIIFAWRMGL